MSMLAVDQSTALQSAALVDEHGTSVAVERWDAEGLRSQRLFEVLPRLLRAACVGADGIDAFAVGLGPGSFSGVRTAVAALRAMALPGRRAVVGIPSPEAIALALATRFPGASRIVVVGDARRRMLWLAEYGIEGGLPAPRGEVGLIGLDDLAPRVAGTDTVLATPDWVRLEPFLTAMKARVRDVISSASVPDAADIARLALCRLASGQRTAVPLPIYLHPAVERRPQDSQVPPPGAPS